MKLYCHHNQFEVCRRCECITEATPSSDALSEGAGS